ncbi:MAG: glucose dehydrogenase [Chloroflexi bacterium]|nr:MAG: glucose dehydrogenase [Chloroflexota bacterium]MBL1194529.1 glucose dehydrogenase [Chloroflexota bacterium]NOH11817.1 glucose dehydrogenase [Chloroflexota bacterium]
MTKRPRRWLRIALIAVAIVVILILALIGWGFFSISNFGGSAAPPPQTTLLPTFVASGPLATSTPIPDRGTVSQPPDPDAYTWELVTDNFERPLDLQSPADGTGRLFVVEQPGRIWILENGQKSGTPFLDITERVNDGSNEQGLLGLAFHPRFAENGFFFVNYSDARGDTVIARYRVSADPNLADPGTETRLLQVRQPYANHNGGGLAFGPDGYLYIGLGDGGLANDPDGNAQSLDTLLGKLLRLDVDNGEPYAIPTDNPFGDEIWAYGLRNPWRFSFDRLTGDLYIGDVGQNAWEEIDFLPADSAPGANFGWDLKEASTIFEGPIPDGLTLIDPVAEYTREDGCSVTGGYVYRGATLDAWQGVYVYGDFCSGKVWGLLQQADGSWHNELLYELDINISSFGLDPAGELYITGLGGQVLKLVER